MRAGRLWGMGWAAFLLFGGICRGQDSLNVTKVGQITYWDNANDLVTQGNYAFVATMRTGLVIVDVSNPEQPAQISQCDTRGEANDLEISGDYAYVADGSGGVAIIDVSNLTNPTIVGCCQTSGPCPAIAISNGYAYAAEYNHGLGVIDISDPANPNEINVIAIPHNTWGVAIVGDLLYCVATYNGGLRIFSLEDPINPVEIGFCDTPGGAYEVVVSDSLAYIADALAGLTIIDISDPFAPSYLTSLYFSCITLDLDIYNSQIFIAGGGSFSIVDVSNPISPLEIGRMEPGASGVVASPDYAYLASGGSGLRVVNTLDPSNLYVIGSFDKDYLRTTALQGNYCFIGTDTKDIQIVDISNIYSPHLECIYQLPSSAAEHIELADNIAYIAAGHDGLRILDVSNAISPIEIGACPGISPYSYFMDVSLQNQYAYVADGDERMIIYNVSNPANPFYVAAVGSIYYSGRSLACHDSMVYYLGTYSDIQDIYTELYAYDVSMPENPILVGSLINMSDDHDIAISDMYAYIVGGHRVTPAEAIGSFRIVDISDPENMAQVFQMFFWTPIYHIELVGDHALIANESGGLKIFSISDPYNPVEVGYYLTPGDAQDVVASGNIAYVADGCYFGIYDISAAIPVAPEPVKTQPASFALYPPHPNPFNPSTVLTFDLPVAGLVKLEVFDINGRRVGAIQESPYPAGTHQLPFNGSGLPSGIYLARLTSGDFQQTQKLVLLK